MRNIILIALLFICSTATAQNLIPFATGRTTDTASTPGSILVPKYVRFPNYATSDTNKVLGIGSNGLLVLRTKSSVAGVDSTIYATNYRVDTAKKKIRDTIAAITLDRAAINGASINRAVTIKPSLTVGGVANYTYIDSLSAVGLRSSLPRYSLNANATYGSMQLYYNTNSVLVRPAFTISASREQILQNADGTIALTSDTANCVQVADSNVRVAGGYLTPSTPTIIHNSAFAYGSGGMTWGTSDSAAIIGYLFNKVIDSVGPVGQTRFLKNNFGASSGEVVLQLKNKLTYGGLDQTQSIMMGIGTGTVSNNNAFIAFGTSMASLNTILSQGQFNFSSMKLASTYNGSTPVVWYGAGSTTSANNGINITYNTYNGSGANVPTSGTATILSIGLNSGTSATFAPTTGTAKRYGINDVGVINQSGGTGVSSSFTNDGITLTAAYDYRAFYASNSTGRAFYSGGTATSSFAGRVTVGTVTDNSTDALQVSGSTNLDGAVKITAGSNKALGSGTLSAGTVTISNTSVTASSKIFLTYSGSITNSGSLTVSAISAGTSFTVTSSNASDANTFNYFIIN